MNEETNRAQLATALARLFNATSLMRIAIKTRATFLTNTTDWERIQDAMRGAEAALGYGGEEKE